MALTTAGMNGGTLRSAGKDADGDKDAKGAKKPAFGSAAWNAKYGTGKKKK